MRYSIDLFKKHKLPTPTAGLVNKIENAKGIKKAEPYGHSYHLHSSLCGIYEGKEMELEPGLYWVMNVYKSESCEMVWNHYLIVILYDGDSYPIAEFLDRHDTAWVKKALPYIKKYFKNGEDANEAIEITDCMPKKPVKSAWNRYKK